MSSRIIRGAERVKRSRISSPSGVFPNGLPQNHVMEIEKQAFEKGYHEGNRAGKQMGEQMMETAVKRYEQTVVELALAHKKLVESMEKETVRLSMAIAGVILEREVSTDSDVVGALVTMALRRLQGHQEITFKVSPEDFDTVRRAVEKIDPNVRVEQMSSLERGDFLLDSHKTHFDGRMKNRLSHIGRALLDE